MTDPRPDPVTEARDALWEPFREVIREYVYQPFGQGEAQEMCARLIALARAEAGVEAAIRTALEGTYYANVPWDAAMLDRVAERFAAALADQERGS